MFDFLRHMLILYLVAVTLIADGMNRTDLLILSVIKCCVT